MKTNKSINATNCRYRKKKTQSNVKSSFYSCTSLPDTYSNAVVMLYTKHINFCSHFFPL